MTVFNVFCVVLCIVFATALPAPDPVIIKLNDGLRYQYRGDGEGNAYLVDQWFKVSDAKEAARYNPDLQNVYHLFTRRNPTVSQPMHFGSSFLLANSNFNPFTRTVFIVHGWTQSATSDINAVLVPAFLQGEDVNVFVLDWSAGSGVSSGTNAPQNAVTSGHNLARTIDWIVTETGTRTSDFHLVGFGLGAHQIAVAGRNVWSGRIAYLTGLDPAATVEPSEHTFGPDAATYTEAIHTTYTLMGHGDVLAHSDFFPNGGDFHPGCGITNYFCNQDRSFFFFAETLTTTSGWGATRCQTITQAQLGLCASLFSVRMGGRMPKTGTSGIFYLRTNAEPPFSTS